MHPSGKTDAVAIGTAVLSFFKVVPWPEIAAFLSCVYMVLRIVGWLWDRGRREP